MRALVVDDSRAMRLVMKNILKAQGFETFEAGHGAEGLERLKEKGPVQLALVDWNMPEMNGLEFVKAVRKDPRYDDMRMVMVTTEADISRMVEALESGANEYLMKPFTKEALHDKLVIVGLTP
jgi:two-component system chemotaxis response regulator CheY